MNVIQNLINVFVQKIMFYAKTQCLKILSSVSSNFITLDENSKSNTTSEKCVCKSGYKYNYVGTGCDSIIGNESEKDYSVVFHFHQFIYFFCYYYFKFSNDLKSKNI